MPISYSQYSSDDVLIEGCRLRQPLAQKCLYERYAARLLAITHRYANDQQEAEQIVNQAFMKIFQSLDRYVEDGKLLPWMRTIVFRTAISYVRERVVFQNIEDINTEKHPLSNSALLDMDVDYILEAMRQLPVATRTVFSLYEIDGYNHPEIAKILGISEGTSKWHLSEAKKRLRLILKNIDSEVATPV